MEGSEQELLAEVDRVLKSGNAISGACREFLAVISPTVDAVSMNVEIPFPDRRTILRCIIKRVQENFGEIVSTTEGDQPHMSTLMLRPLCEDLIYGVWLRTLPEEDADKLVLLTISADITKSLLAQSRFLPRAYASLRRFPDSAGAGLRLPAAAVAGSLGADIGDVEVRYSLLKKELKELGLRLGWPKGKLPSVYEMAVKSDLRDVYDFFYHGSSKAVHANLHNMSRMVWGDPKEHIFTIDSHHFERYYVAFALAYGMWLSAEVMEQIAKPEFPEEFQLIARDAYDVWLAVVLAGLAQHGGLPPLVTEAELRWP